MSPMPEPGSSWLYEETKREYFISSPVSEEDGDTTCSNSSASSIEWAMKSSRYSSSPPPVSARSSGSIAISRNASKYSSSSAALSATR